MLLIINTCKEPLHYFEFVRPIEEVAKSSNIDFKTEHFKEILEEDILTSDKVIICGTSLKDNKFIESLHKFRWIKTTEKPILGICAGMQIISLMFSSKLKNKTEIGFFKEEFKKEFLCVKGEQEVYHLHNHYPTLPKEFESFTSSKLPQAIKHKTKEIYGVLFHPEVRNKEIIKKFLEKS